MKSLKSISFFVLSLFVFTMVSCDDEPLDDGLDPTAGGSGSGGGGIATGSFQVDFDGQTFVADFIEATRTDDVINITGMRGADQELVTLTINETTVGTYQFGLQDGILTNAASYVEENGSSNVWVSLTDGMTSQGQIIISSIDDVNLTMSGTFHFTGTNPTSGAKEFTNGVFTNVTFSDGLTNNNDNTFFANLDGVEFVEDQVNGAMLTTGGVSSISISATKNNGETIGLNFPADITPGDYDFEGFGERHIAQYIGEDPMDIYLGDGSYTILSHDTTNKTITGTFSFTATLLLAPGTKEITEGEFEVTYF